MTYCFDLIQIPLKFHEAIPISYRVMGCTRMKITQNKHKNNQRAMTLKPKEGKLLEFYPTRRLDLINIPIKFHEDI